MIKIKQMEQKSQEEVLEKILNISGHITEVTKVPSFSIERLLAPCQKPGEHISV